MSVFWLLLMFIYLRSARTFHIPVLIHRIPTVLRSTLAAGEKFEIVATRLRKMSGLSPLSLNEDEKELFTMLRNVVEDESPGSVVRVAGGWVRDKLLGVRGKEEDIDIALDNMSGKDFSVILNNWYKDHGKKTVKVGIIQQNPEKSKHLETATVQLGKFSVDFVNLRTETYADNSRIPEIKIGTPEEDALRRDLTINALFYNIITENVEDFSGRGIEDLQAGIARTPLPSLVTFQDDPLRVLRAVRFACRFGFTLAQELVEAACDPSVHNALGTKVSRERVLQEVDQMMRAPHASRAAALLNYMDVLQLVLPLPSEGIVSVSPSSSAAGATAAQTRGGAPVLVTTPVDSDAFAVDYHHHGCALLLTTALLVDNAAAQTGPGVFESEAVVPTALRGVFQNGDQLKHLRSVLNSMEKSGDDIKILRYSQLTNFGANLLCPNPTKKNNQLLLTKRILLNELKMPTKDVANAVGIHSSAVAFINVLRTILKEAADSHHNNNSKNGDAETDEGRPPHAKKAHLAATITPSSSSLSSSSSLPQDGRAAAGEAIATRGGGGSAVSVTTSDDATSAPTFGSVNRLELGLLIRSAGDQYQLAIVSAISQLLLEVLAKKVAVVGAAAPGASADSMGASDTELPREYTSIVDALVAVCGLSKMATNKFIYRTLHPSFFTEVELQKEKTVIETFGGPSLAADVLAVLVAGNRLVEAIELLGIGDAWSMSPLLSGDDVKTVLTKIPRGTAFGEIMQKQIQWMLCNPQGSNEQLSEFLRNTYPAFV